MTALSTFPLVPVVAFLRKHGVLSVLEGAPVIGPACNTLFLSALSRAALVEMTGLCELRGTHLYLGTDTVCPAAEGWASRVLAMALKTTATHLSYAVDGRISLVNGERLECQWLWRPPDSTTPYLFRERRISGEQPTTPAGHLAAVLLHELERA